MHVMCRDVPPSVTGSFLPLLGRIFGLRAYLLLLKTIILGGFFSRCFQQKSCGELTVFYLPSTKQQADWITTVGSPVSTVLERVPHRLQDSRKLCTSSTSDWELSCSDHVLEKAEKVALFKFCPGLINKTWNELCNKVSNWLTCNS